jgi:C_GCAxxG_C_C family probable redox protein
MEKSEQAKELFMQGYNCSQSVVGAFAEELGIERAQAFKLASSFGGGMGGLREVCGAVSGMFIVAGFLYGYDDPQNPQAKAEHYKRIQSLAIKFKEKNPSIICKELLGLSGIKAEPSPAPRTAEYYKKRPCAELVAEAAQIMQDFIEQNPIPAK